MRAVFAAVPAVVLGCAGAHAACPMELAVFGDRDRAGEIDFSPAKGLAVVTNAFRMVLERDVVLDGIVMWSGGDIRRPYGFLMYQCPDGDVTGEELTACTVWEGVIYTSDDKGNIGLLPAEGEAPATLIFPDLGPSLAQSSVHGANGLSRLPGDVFALRGCQE
jgi:hypothetical protein